MNGFSYDRITSKLNYKNADNNDGIKDNQSQ